MPIFRVSRLKGNFATVDHRFLERRDMSSKAKGVLSYLVHRPNDWIVSTTYMANNCFMETRQWLQKVFKELIGLGYIRRARTRTPDGKLGEMQYMIYDSIIKFLSFGDKLRVACRGVMILLLSKADMIKLCIICRTLSYGIIRTA